MNSYGYMQAPCQKQAHINHVFERKASEMRVSIKRQIRQKFQAAGHPAPSLVGWTMAELLDFDSMVKV